MDRIEKLKELLSISPIDSFLRHALALEYVKLGNDQLARNIFEEVLKDDPGYIGSYYQLGKLLERNGETALAIQWYEKGMEAAKGKMDNRAFSELRSAYEELVY